MYEYNDFDHAFLAERNAQFRAQVETILEEATAMFEAIDAGGDAAGLRVAG